MKTSHLIMQSDVICVNISPSKLKEGVRYKFRYHFLISRINKFYEGTFHSYVYLPNHPRTEIVWSDYTSWGKFSDVIEYDLDGASPQHVSLDIVRIHPKYIKVVVFTNLPPDINQYIHEFC